MFEALPVIPLLGNDVLDCIFAAKSVIGRVREEVIGDWRKVYIQSGPKVSKGLIKCIVCLFLT